MPWILIPREGWGFERRGGCPIDYNQHGSVPSPTGASRRRDPGPFRGLASWPVCPTTGLGRNPLWKARSWRVGPVQPLQVALPGIPFDRTDSGPRPGEWVCVSVWVSAAEQAGIVADGFGVLLSEAMPRGSVTSPGVGAATGESAGPFPRPGTVGSTFRCGAGPGGERWLTIGNSTPRPHAHCGVGGCAEGRHEVGLRLRGRGGGGAGGPAGGLCLPGPEDRRRDAGSAGADPGPGVGPGHVLRLRPGRIAARGQLS